ncbi:MAG: hypothetical protein HGA36_03770 [Candidatus Moranbacteria bacterium]|nr:hypothetical protein [Candidatus Moranbacteria bacterium]
MQTLKFHPVKLNQYLIGASLFLISFFMLPSFVSAAPEILAPTPTTISNAESVAISGSGFGAKSVALPIKWDNFESGADGDDLAGWSLSSSGGPNPKYSTSRKHAGSSAGMAQFFGSNYNCSAYMGLNDLSEVYFSYWVFIEHVSGDVSRNIKTARAVGSVEYKDPNVTMPGMGVTHLNENPALYYWSPNDLNTTSRYPIDHGISVLTLGGWHHIEMYGKASDVDIANGAIKFWDNGVEAWNKTDAITVTSQQAPPQSHTYKNFVLPFYVAHDQGGDYNIYYDDVYVDNTQARIMLCAGNAWSNRAHCEIQNPTAWSDTSSAVTINQGAFLDGTTAYLYVVDENGDVNSSGYSVTLSGVLDVTAPSAPTGLGVI